MKEKVVQLISFSSIYNDNLQNELRNNKEFCELFDQEVINLEIEKREFEKVNGYKEYAKNGKLKKIFYWLQFNKYLGTKYAFLKGSIVDIQFVSTQYFYLLPFLESTFRKIIISFWGSDLLRLEEKQFFKLKQIVRAANYISFETSEFTRIFKKKIGSGYDAKIRTARFGISLLNDIDAISEKDLSNFASKHGIDRNRKIVAIGYNRGKAHQHLEVVESIIREGVDPNQLQLVFPWTYGPEDKEYQSEIQKLLDGKYDYSFIDNSLTNLEVAALREITNYMIQVQTTDVMSSSMLETLYAKNTVITGTWLPYDDIYNAGVVMNTVSSVSEVGKMLTKVLNEPMKEDILDRNKLIIGDLYTWDSCISTWVELYK